MSQNIDKVRQYIANKHDGLRQFGDHDDIIDHSGACNHDSGRRRSESRKYYSGLLSEVNNAMSLSCTFDFTCS